MEREPEIKSTPAGTPTRDRKPYSKPTCTSEEIFETSALACGKLPGGGGLCNSVPSAS